MTAKRHRLLLVDDDPGIRALVSAFLTREGFDIAVAADSTEMEQKLAAAESDGQPFALLILDLMLPNESGLDVLKRMQRKPDAPAIIILSAMGEVADRVEGLELGADDYLAKPCNPRELLARVRAVLRRRQAEAGPASRSVGLSVAFAGWRLDRVRRELRSPGGVQLSLSDGEFLLLNHFIENPGQTLSREALLELSGQPDSGDRSIDVQISRLRRKLSCDTNDGGDLIRTVRNGGYVMKADVRTL